MMKKVFLVLILLKFYIINGQTLNFIDTTCFINGTQASYFLDRTVVAKLRSPNFPVSLLNNTSEPACSAFFQTADTDYRIWVGLYNGFSNFISITDGLPATRGYTFDSYDSLYYYASAGQTLFLQQQSIADENKHWNAFEGVVTTFNPSKSSCPFASEDIEFISLPQDTVIPLTSSYNFVMYPNEIASREPTKCHWTFDHPSGSNEYNSYLKLVLKGLKINENVIFELFQGDQRIQRFQNNITTVDEPEVFYFYAENSVNSTRFQLFWNDTTTNRNTHMYFFALVSIVTFPVEYPYHHCNTTTNADKTLKGCKYNIIVLSETEYYLTTHIDLGSDGSIGFFTEHFDLERNVDILSLSTSINKTIIDRDTELRIIPSNGYSQTDPILSFFADGSIQQGGFHLTLQKLDCRCVTTEIVITNDEAIALNPVICNNQSCPIKISMDPSNSAPFFSITVEPILRRTIDYTQWTNSNGDSEKLTSESFQSNRDIARWFLKDDIIILEYNFGIGTSNIQPFNSIEWYLTTSIAYTEYNNTVDLNSTYYLLDMSDIAIYSTFTICTSEEDILELFVSRPYSSIQNKVVYDSDNLKNFMGSIASLFNTQSSISSQSGCFTVMDTDDDNHNNELFFRLKNTQSKNCSSTNNVFSLFEDDSYFNAESTNDGPCEIIIMNKLPGLVINVITTTSQEKIIFKSAANQNIFMEMNPNETALYKGTILYTAALSIILPPSSKLLIGMSTWPSQRIQTFDGQKGVMASPTFSGMGINSFLNLINFPYYYELVSSLNDQRMTVTLKVNVLHGNQQVTINNGTVTTTLTANQVITVEGTAIKVIFPFINDDNYAQDYFLMEYSVRYLDRSPTTLFLETTTPLKDSPSSTQLVTSVSSSITPIVPVPSVSSSITPVVPVSSSITPVVSTTWSDTSSHSSSTLQTAPTTSDNSSPNKSSTSAGETMTSPTIITATNKADVTNCFSSYKLLILLYVFTIMLK